MSEAPGEVAPRPSWEGLVTAELELSARLCAATERLADQFAARQDLADRMATGIYWVPAPGFPLSTLPYVPPSNGGPGLKFCWAVQRVTVGPVGATSDAVTVYKGRSSVDIAPQNALSTFSGAVGAFPSWTPGRTGCVLMPGESLIVGGTITGSNPVLSWDVLVMDLDMLPLFLL